MSVVRVLGPVDVVADDGSVLGSGSALRRTLLALLAVHRGEVLSPDLLMEHLWGDEQPDSGVRALRFHISRLRKECGTNTPIETRPGGYQLDLPAGSVDTGMFEELAGRARAEPDDLRSVELCSQALGLWRGEAFVDVAGCPTLDHEASRLDELRLAVIEYSFVRRLAAGAAGELVSDLSQLVNQYPLREGLWRSLIIAQYRAGQQADALASYERLRANLAESLGLNPSPELQDLQLSVLRQDPELTAVGRGDTARSADLVRDRSHDLPLLTTSFVELDGAVDKVAAMVDTHRLVTLTGSGGVGKTRLALEVGARADDWFQDGVRLIELASVAEPDAVIGAIATGLSVTPRSGVTTLDSIVDWCRGRQILLIVDNCEHVIDAAGHAIREILISCPTVTLIATSREALGLDGEWSHRVESLDRAAAVELFTDRARAADGRFVLDATDVDVAARICERLDGVPLAIELAAARMRSMSPNELYGHLDDRFRLLRGTGRGRQQRHHTLRAAVAWSYQLLSDGERTVFDRASVFAGSFDLPAAEAVCGSDPIDPDDVIDLFVSLVDKSLVVAQRTGTGMRYRLLETLRAYGEEQLIARGDGFATRERHLHHYVELAEHTDRIFRGPQQVDAQRLFGLEWDNLRDAHRWTITTNNLDHSERVLTATWQFALHDCRGEFADWAEQTLALGTDERRPDPHTYGIAAYYSAPYIKGEPLADPGPQRERASRGIDAAPRPDHPSTTLCWVMLQESFERLIGTRPTSTISPIREVEAAAAGLDLDHDWWALIELAQGATSMPRVRDEFGKQAASSKQRIVEQLTATASRVGSPILSAHAALLQGDLLIDDVPPDTAGALVCYNRALAIASSTGQRLAEGSCLRAVALATTDTAADQHAAQACREALQQLFQTRNWDMMHKTMESAILVLASLGFLEPAAVAVGHQQEFWLPFGREFCFGFRVRSLELVRQDDRAEQWMELGTTMDSDDVVRQTIEHLAEAAAQDQPGTTPAGP